ncbi:MAG TPA: 16S rRNA (cytosine(967)-C(5))-methyltransferase RsmB [Pyrinomonadaceae bacterium]|nr:16S rRNA (cytosine(967)-C(5))-methyltransferase RsmB [Pyrinomonadaceae bacterium]
MAIRKEISPARRAAFEILRRVADGAFSSVLLALEEPTLKPADRSLTHELVLGVLRWQLWLDRVIEHFAQRRVESLDLPVRIALRLGLYQLRFLTRIPAAAAVNESVSLVRRVKLSSAAALVNAVLRRAIREGDYDPAAEVDDPLVRVSVQTSHPLWLLERWVKAFGLAEAEAFARANNQVPPMAFRVVRSRTSVDDVVSVLTDAGVSVQPSSIARGAFRVFGGATVLRELSAAGQIYLQDEASQLVAEVLDVQRGDRVLDLCAAPGGKTTLSADHSHDDALIVAADRYAARIATITNTAALHRLHSIKPVLLDGLQPLPFRAATFDRILVDAPCSGTGTLRRNPEIRYRLSNNDIGEFSAAQKQFLANAVEVLKPGGRLVYSTCSVERDENELVIESFLSMHPDLHLVNSTRTWPHKDGSDGFFIATLERQP